MNWPKVSIIVCTYNCEEFAKRCFSAFIEQDYPKEKLELLALDGGSTDKTRDICKSLGVKVIHNKEKLPEGKGRGKWLGFKQAKGWIVIFVDSDNKPMQKDWIQQMVKPLINDQEVNFSICRMAVVKEDILLNKYLSLIGTDPFMAYKSIDSLLALEKLKLIDKGDYYTYNITPKKFIITGGYYFAIKKETLNKIGGYTQDTDVVYNLAKAGLANVAIPKNATIHHLISNSIINFTKKKIKWADIYFITQIKDRDFSWMPSGFNENIKMFFRVINNLFFIYPFFVGIKMSIKQKQNAWLLHPILVWLTTYAYLYSYLKTRFK